MNLQTLQEIGYLITTAVLVFSFWKMGGNTATSQVIATYKERVEQLQQTVNDLTAKLGELTGQLKEKDDRIRTLESIATNRNPELETFIKQMTLVSLQAQEFMKSSTEGMNSLRKLLGGRKVKTLKVIK